MVNANVEKKFLVYGLSLILFCSLVSASSVRINEILPNSFGADDALMPDGEWIELYNNGIEVINLEGFVLYDSYDTHELYITSTNVNGNLMLQPHEYLVVYRDGDGDFSLNNDGDEVRLYDGYPVSENKLIDSIGYTSSTTSYSWSLIDSNWEQIPPTPGAENVYIPQTEIGVVDYVIDGDTIKLETCERVRLIGIDTPEECEYYYEESKNKLKDLVEGKTITLERDIENKDMYNRLLRYIYVDDLFINLILVEEGFARAYPFEPNTKYKDLFANAENEAKENGLGIWGVENDCDWQIEILLGGYIFENGDDVNWTVKISKNYGEKANVSIRGYVKDLLSGWQRDYDRNFKNINSGEVDYSPNLWVNRFYSIFFNITHLDCKDTDLGNNFDYKFIIVLPEKLDQNYTKIKINELLPDPQGYDNAAMPEGEWVELYNSGDKDIDIEGLGLKDDYGSEIDIFISDSNTIGGTVISAHDYLVVYMNGRSGFLNNDGFEKISLYKDEYLIDEVTYSGSVEGLSWSKIDNMWKLTIPTSHSDNYFDKTTNKSSLEIEEIYLGSDKKANWGDIIRVKVMVYKGDTGKKSISLGLEQGLSKKTKFNAEEKFMEYILTLPIQIDLNCDKKFDDGFYELILEGLGERDSKKIKIEGESNLCEKESSKKEKTSTNIKKMNAEDTNQNYEKVIYRDMEEITGNIVYESNEIKAKRSAIYFFCALLILLIIQKRKNDTSQNNNRDYGKS